MCVFFLVEFDFYGYFFSLFGGCVFLCWEIGFESGGSMRIEIVDIIVVGGGVMGLVMVWELMCCGCRFVVLEWFVCGYYEGVLYGVIRNFNNVYVEEYYFDLFVCVCVGWEVIGDVDGVFFLCLYGFVIYGDFDIVLIYLGFVVCCIFFVVFLFGEVVWCWLGMCFVGDVLWLLDVGVVCVVDVLCVFEWWIVMGGGDVWWSILVVYIGEDFDGVVVDLGEGCLLCVGMVVVIVGVWM